MWNDIPVHVIDFEGSNLTGVVEMGIVTLHKRDITYHNTRLCYPANPIPPADTRNHHITNKLVEGTLPFSQEWDIFNKIRQTGPFCAHNAHVENNFLKNTWPYPSPATNFLNPDSPKTPAWGPYVDTLQIAKKLHPNLKSHKLTDLIDHFGLKPQLQDLASQCCPKDRSKSHCALYDCLACGLLLLFFAQQIENPTLQKILTLSASSAAQFQDAQQLRLNID